MGFGLDISRERGNTGIVEIVQLYTLMLIGVLSVGGFAFARNTARAKRSSGTETTRWHSHPNYHGYLTGWSIATVGLGLLCLWSLVFPGQTTALVMAILLSSAFMGLTVFKRIEPAFPARIYTERFIKAALFGLSGLAILTTFGIVFSLIFESLRFFSDVSVFDFLTGLNWSPQTALRSDQIGSSGSFGAVPVLLGTFMIMAIAICVAGPVGLMIAIYLSEYASRRMRAIVKPIIEILAGIPTVVFGFFALLTVGPAIRNLTDALGFAVPTQSAISAGVVMGVMIIPLISSLSDDVVNAVPQSLRDGAYALGATKSETMKQVIFPSALPGIMAAFLLAISRAIGETMIVVMAAGRAANLTGNPFESVTTVTVQIVALLTGGPEFDSTRTLAAFALGLTLFAITLTLNIIALRTVRKYREVSLA